MADLQTTQQSRKVSGVVLDTNNQPLVGATILQKGTSNGVITNLEGRFTIDLNGKCSSIGDFLFGICDGDC